MPDPNEENVAPDENAAAQDTGAAAPESGEGQADGSPPPGDNRPTEGDPETGGAEKQALELRRKVTEQGELLKTLDGAFMRLQSHPKWASEIEPFLTGKPVQAAPADDPELGEIAESMFVDKAEGMKVLSRLRKKFLDEAKAELRGEILPMARAVGNSREQAAYGNALEDAGYDPKLQRTSEFKSFVKEYELDNPWIRDVRSRDIDAAANLVVKDFKRSVKRPSRDPEEARNASLDRGGGNTAGAAAAASAARTVEVPRNASFQQWVDAHKNGGRPAVKR